ncbi:MAG: hypothetical protein COB98_01905 [Flavobacteriaceae bacterium]|nr:MAG: hypothetical protein COB98_01905 [Flavobacteriaceae bacterium]
MKILKLLSVFVFAFFLTSCLSIKVSSDYDSKTDFTQYKTFAFYKKGIDKVAISSLDKKRILAAVEKELLAKGFTKSENPDVLVNIFTKAQQKVTIHQNGYYNMWHPWYYGPNFGTHISNYTEGTLFIDLIDARKKELAWQGIGSGVLARTGNVLKKEAKIQEFVFEIMKNYPPTK